MPPPPVIPPNMPPWGYDPTQPFDVPYPSTIGQFPVQRVVMFDADFGVLPTHTYIALVQTLTNQRFVNLPLANTYPSGVCLTFADEVGGINGANTIVIRAAGGDTIEGLPTFTATPPFSTLNFYSDQNSRWTYLNQPGATGPTGPPGAAGAAGPPGPPGVPGSGGNTQRSITQIGHGFVAGQVLRMSGIGSFALARANNAPSAEVCGIVQSVVDADHFVLVTNGYVTGLAVNTGIVYFLDPAISGGITNVEPSTVGQVSKPLMITDSISSGYFFNWRGLLINAPAAQAPFLIKVPINLTAVAFTDLLTVPAGKSYTFQDCWMLITANSGSSNPTFTIWDSLTNAAINAAQIINSGSTLPGTSVRVTSNVSFPRALVTAGNKLQCNVTVASTGTMTGDLYILGFYTF